MGGWRESHQGPTRLWFVLYIKSLQKHIPYKSYWGYLLIASFHMDVLNLFAFVDSWNTPIIFDSLYLCHLCCAYLYVCFSLAFLPCSAFRSSLPLSCCSSPACLPVYVRMFGISCMTYRTSRCNERESKKRNIYIYIYHIV